MRLAFVSPLPPAPTGIADYALDLLRLLAPHYEIEAFHDQGDVDGATLPEVVRVSRASALLERHDVRPFDLVVYQMGNGRSHDFVYPLLPRLPGLLVLHDLVLHHARARMFLESAEVRRYAADPGNSSLRAAASPVLERWHQELRYSYPEQAERLSSTSLGTTGTLLAYGYPLFRIPVEASRATAVHNAFMADAVRREVPEARVCRVPMPVAVPEVSAAPTREIRERLGFGHGDLVVGTFGLLTPEKRVETLVRAAARVTPHVRGLRLLLVGPTPDRPALDSMLNRHGLAASSVVTGRVPFEEIAPHVAASDIVVQLRYPTARETSAALLRVLALGRPTVVSDLENLAEIPADAVLRADVSDEEGEVARALSRLAADPALRNRVGVAARAYVEAQHAPERCLEGWQAALRLAADAPDPPRRAWPAHWLEGTPGRG